LGVVDRDANRIGITASRKVGNAVVRNQFKRRIREWFRTHRDELDPGLDLLVIARRSGARLDSGALDRRLRHLLGLEPKVE
jgi:ribonuclease P protein component